MTHESHHAGYLISDDPSRIDVDVIHHYLARSYWAEGIPRDVVARAVENSFCIGIYQPAGQQVGLVRVITDFTTFAYLCDVFVLEPHRGRGLAKAAMAFLTSHPRLQGLRRMQLVTRDAHPLYSQFGFSVVAEPALHMEKRLANPYRNG